MSYTVTLRFYFITKAIPALNIYTLRVSCSFYVHNYIYFMRITAFTSLQHVKIYELFPIWKALWRHFLSLFTSRDCYPHFSTVRPVLRDGVAPTQSYTLPITCLYPSRFPILLFQHLERQAWGPDRRALHMKFKHSCELLLEF